MSSTLALTTASLQTLGSLVYYLAFGISFLESLAFIGLIIPSTTLLIALGFLISWGGFHGPTLFLAVTVGAFLGNLTSFYLGTHGVQWFRAENKIFKLEYLRKSEKFFIRHGAKSVFFASFISPLRSIIPFVAGLLSMPRGRFLVYAGAGSALSAVLYLGIGYGLGVVSDRSLGFFSHAERLLIILGVLAVGILFFRRFLIRSGEVVGKTVKIFVLATLGRLAATRSITVLLGHHDRLSVWLRAEPRRIGIAIIIAGCIVLLSLGSITPWVHRYFDSGGFQAFDLPPLSRAFLWRASPLTKVFRVISYLGSPSGILGISAVAAGLLIFQRKLRTLAVYVVMYLGVSGMVVLMKHIVGRLRPDEFIPVYQETSPSFPSYHAALILAVTFFLAYLFGKNCTTWAMKVNVWLGAGFLTLLIGITRVYLGVHYPSDVLAGYIVGGGWFLIGLGLDKALTPRYELDTPAVLS